MRGVSFQDVSQDPENSLATCLSGVVTRNRGVHTFGQSPMHAQADGNVAVKPPEPVSVAQTQTDERVATELPQPVAATQPATGAVTAPEPELDRELSAIVTILNALDGLTADEVKRALAYVADRKGIKQETEL
jgi:hypothetical protein